LRFFYAEDRKRRPPIGFIPEGNDVRMLLQKRVDDLALYPDAAAVNDADLPKTFLDRLIEVFLHYDMNLLWLERMKVNGILDRDVVHTESI